MELLVVSRFMRCVFIFYYNLMTYEGVIWKELIQEFEIVWVADTVAERSNLEDDNWKARDFNFELCTFRFLYRNSVSRVRYKLFVLRNARRDAKRANVSAHVAQRGRHIMNEANGISFVINITHYEIAKLN